MTLVLLAISMLATVATALWLAFDGNAVMALPLAIVFAGPLRPMARKAGRGGITAAEIASPSHDETRI